MRKTLGIVLGMQVLVAGLFSTNAFAANITVTTTNATGGATDCTLSDALKAARDNAVVNGCAVGDAASTDTIILGSGDYVLATGTDCSNTMTRNTKLSGVSKTVTKIVYPSSADYYCPIDTKISQLGQIEAGGDIMLENVTLSRTGPDARPFALSTNVGGTSSLSSIVIRDTTITDGVILFHTTSYSSDTIFAGNNTLSIENVDTVGIYVAQKGFTTTLKNNKVGSAGIMSETIDQTSGSTAILNTEVRYVDHPLYPHADNSGIGYLNVKAPNAKLTVDNSIVSGFITGLLNIECDGVVIPRSLYLTNSMVEKASIGLVNACGHAVVNNSTFSDINGSAVVAYANTRIQSSGVRASTSTELYNSTFTGIRPSNVTRSPKQTISEAWGASDSSTKALGIVSVVADMQTPSQTPVATGSKLIMKHNTFAGNTLGADMANVAFDPAQPMGLDTVELRNNAFEGQPTTASYTATTNTVENNMTTATAQPGISKVDSFVLGAFKDNGGTSPVGVNGALGNVKTFRPLYGSPLIDGAPTAGLSSDQRGQVRSQLARFDVGAVEVTDGEVKGDMSAVAAPPVARAPAQPVASNSPAATKLAATGVDVWLLAGGALMTVGVLLGTVVRLRS